MEEKEYFIVESGDCINPLIVGGLTSSNLFAIFWSLFNFKGAQTIGEAKEIKKLMEKKHKKKFEIIENNPSTKVKSILRIIDC